MPDAFIRGPFSEIYTSPRRVLTLLIVINESMHIGETALRSSRRRRLRLDVRLARRAASADFPYTYLAEREIPRGEITFARVVHRHTSAAAARIAARRRRFACYGRFRSATKAFERRARPLCHLSKHFSDASTSRIREQHLCEIHPSPRSPSRSRAAEESRTRAKPRRQVSTFSERVLARPLVSSFLLEIRRARVVCVYVCVLSRADARGHAKEIACYSSIRSHGTFPQSFTFITDEQLALPLLMPRYGNPRRMRARKIERRLTRFSRGLEIPRGDILGGKWPKVMCTCMCVHSACVYAE